MRQRLWVCVSPQRHNGAPQPQSRNGDTWYGYPSGVWRGTVQQERYSRIKTCLYGTASRLAFLAQTPLLEGGAQVSYVLQPIRLPVLAFQRTVSVIREN